MCKEHEYATYKENTNGQTWVFNFTSDQEIQIKVKIQLSNQWDFLFLNKYPMVRT